MSEASIVQSLVLGQMTAFSTPTGIDRVKVHNDSSFYLRVYFGLGAPSGANSGGWHATVSPGARPVLQVVGAASGSIGLDFTNSQTTGSYQGQVVVLPFSPAGAILTSGGVLTGGSLCYLTSFYPGEYAEPGGQVDAFVQGAKQGRYQGTQGGVVPYIGAVDQGSPDGTMIGVASLLTSTRTPYLFAANKAGASLIHCYMYGHFCSWSPVAGAVSALNFHLDVALMDSTLTVVRASAEIARYKAGVIGANITPACEYINDQPCRPRRSQLSIAQGVLQENDNVVVRFRNDGQVGNWASTHNIDMLIDMVNQTPLYEMPHLPSPVQTAPYNAVTNPQTY